MNKTLLGKQVRITSDNDNYNDFKGRTLTITLASNSGRGYDQTMYPMQLCDLEDSQTGEPCPFALYEYEFELI